jgi:hypothetical protein
MGIDPASLTRALNGNARLDTVQKIATALGVSMKSLFVPMDDVEGFIRIRGNVFQFNSREELDTLIMKNNVIILLFSKTMTIFVSQTKKKSYEESIVLFANVGTGGV